MAADDRPPILPSWGAAYALVLGALGLLVIFFSVVSRVYR
jgi:hypothetical protein